MSIPTPYELGVRRHVPGMATDAHGRATDTYAPAVPWWVHGYAPGANTEPHDPNRDASHVLWTVYAPADADLPGERDRVVLGGVEYDVEGRAADWTHGPWDHPTAGAVVELVRKDG